MIEFLSRLWLYRPGLLLQNSNYPIPELCCIGTDPLYQEFNSGLLRATQSHCLYAIEAERGDHGWSCWMKIKSESYSSQGPTKILQCSTQVLKWQQYPAVWYGKRLYKITLRQICLMFVNYIRHFQPISNLFVLPRFSESRSRKIQKNYGSTGHRNRDLLVSSQIDNYQNLNKIK